jgi:hypothetical protein
MRVPQKPVAERLQVKGKRRLAVIGAPAAVDGKIGVAQQRSEMSQADVVLVFVADRVRLGSTLPGVLKKVSKGAIIWIAYPKLTSKLAADLSRDLIRALAARFGLDTVSQIAIDDDWSALRVKRVR